MAHFTSLIDQLPLTQHLVSRALDIVCSAQGEGTEEERRAEWLPLFYSPDPKSGSIHPRSSYAGEDNDKTTERTLAAIATPQWERIALRAVNIRHELLGGRYFDVLWRQRKRHGIRHPHEFARAAMARYESAARERFGNIDLYWDALLACQHVGHLARDLSDLSGGLSAARLIGELLDSVKGHWGPRAPGVPLYAAEALDHLVQSVPKTKRNPDLLAEIEGMLDRLRRFMPAGSALQNTYVGRDVLTQFQRLEQLLDIDSQRTRELEQAESRVEEARARAKVGESLIAGSIMADAAAQFTAMGEAEKAAAAKREARCLFDAGTAQMRPVVASVSIPEPLLLDLVDRMASLGSLGASLSAAVSSHEVISSWEEATRFAAKLAQEHPLQALVPTMRVVDGRPVSQESSGHNEILRRNWLMGIALGVNMVWNPLIEKLKLKGLEANGLVEELAKAGVVAPHNRLALHCAVEAALSGEYLVACHMLPPIIESAIRSVCTAAGIDMNAYRPKDGGQFQERTMGALFDEDPDSTLVQGAMALFGRDLWNWYRAVLFDEKSLNLRNRSAHGLLRDEECTPETSQTLLLALVALLRTRAAVARGVQLSTGG